MPAFRAIALLATFLCLSASLFADTVTLKSGEKLEGKILGETETEITMSVQVSATIKDERVVKREEIAKVDKVQPDEEAWAVMSAYAPGSESLEGAEYDRIKGALGYFTSTFPKSPHAAAAQKRLDEFTSEQVRVSVGEVKLNGQWIPKEKVQEERIQIGGRILLNRMKRTAGAGQLTDAMANFDQLEKGFAGSLSFPEAVELARRVLPGLAVAVEQRQAALKRQLEDEKQRLATSQGAERSQLDALIKNERARTEATLAASERAGVKWLPLQPATERSLTSLSARVKTEMTRVNALRLEKMQESAKLAQDAAAELSAGNLDAAERTLKEATSAWPDNELAKRTQAKLADAKKAAPAPKPGTPTPAPKPKPSASSGTAPAPAAAVGTEPEAETPLFKRPAFFIGLAAVIAFGAIIGKKIAKARAAGDNVLDK